MLWLKAVVLIGLLRGPLRSLPAVLKKPLKFVVASCICAWICDLPPLGSRQKTAKHSSPLTGLWVLFSGLPPIGWIISSFGIFLSRPKQKPRTTRVPAGPVPRPKVQQQEVDRTVPAERFADVGGMDAAKEQIRSVVQAH